MHGRWLHMTCAADSLLTLCHHAADDDTWLDAAALVDTLRGLCQSPDCADEKIYLGGRLWWPDDTAAGQRIKSGGLPRIMGN